MSEQLKYEEAMDKLEEIMGQLDRGEVKLDESIALFTQGLELVKLCNDYLLDAENKIEILVNGEVKDYTVS